MALRRLALCIAVVGAVMAPLGVAAAEPTSRTSGQIAFQITNLDKASSIVGGLVFSNTDGVVWPFGVSEPDEGGIDLNGDGDGMDLVPFFYNSTTGTLTNLGTKGPGGLNGIPILDEAGFIGFWVDEQDVGPAGVDLSLDGDKNDNALAFYHIATDTVTFAPLGSGEMAPVGSQWAVDMDEDRIFAGGLDLNIDGDKLDNVPFLYNPTTNTYTNLGILGGGKLNTGGGSFVFATLLYGGGSDRLAFATSEADMGAGGVDVNGDGDKGDDVPHLYDLAGGTMTNLGGFADRLAGFPLLFGGLVQVIAEEAASGASDLNGDGDANDSAGFIFDPVTTGFTNLGSQLGGVAAVFATPFAGKLLVQASEASTGAAGKDLNGDGDADDGIVYLYDPGTGSAVNLSADLRLAGSTHIFGDRLIIAADETGFGPGTDYNGDGDTNDSVIHIYDPATQLLTNLRIDGEVVALGFDVNASAQVPLLRHEADNGEDYNGDGDTADTVLHFFDPATGVLANTGLAGFPEARMGDAGLVAVSEADQGGTDLNGDGDAIDYVVYFLRITGSTQSLDDVGLVDTATGKWFLRDAKTGAVTSFFYGNPVDLPIAGDWDGDGIATPGLYRQSDGFFYARNSNSQGVADVECFAGDPSDIPVAGDWDGDGDDNLGIYRPSQQKFYLFTSSCTGTPMGAAQIVLNFGNPGDKPVAGDWDGDGKDEIGLHRESTGFFYWRNTVDTGIADGQIFFGDPADRFVSGDWGIIDGVDTPAIFRPGDATFYFRHTLTPGNADSQFPFGEGPWLPVGGQFGL